MARGLYELGVTLSYDFDHCTKNKILKSPSEI